MTPGRAETSVQKQRVILRLFAAWLRCPPRERTMQFTMCQVINAHWAILSDLWKEKIARDFDLEIPKVDPTKPNERLIARPRGFAPQLCAGAEVRT